VVMKETTIRNKQLDAYLRVRDAEELLINQDRSSAKCYRLARGIQEVNGGEGKRRIGESARGEDGDSSSMTQRSRG